MLSVHSDSDHTQRRSSSLDPNQTVQYVSMKQQQRELGSLYNMQWLGTPSSANETD